jgi:hypothetical protein
MRIGRREKGQAFHCVELFNRGVKSFIFDTDIKNFITVKSSIKWVITNYLKVLFVSSPLLMLSISYLKG